jgi:lathosterol oxidase
MSEPQPPQTGPQTARVWNHAPALPIRNSAVFVWPPQPRAALRRLVLRWVSLTPAAVLLMTAVLVWALLQPAAETTAHLSPGWILGIWLRNLALMGAFAGGLHLWLHHNRGQGNRLRYDARPMQRDNAAFSFHDQVRDNAFWTLASGVTFWTLYEVAYLWGAANGVFPTFDLAGNWHWALLWLLALPLFTSAHFYWVHRLLHWPPLYRRVHALHHRSVNVGPWSGLSMHPVESALYLSAPLIHMIVPSHPLIFLVHMYLKAIGPAFSHAGFEAVLTGETDDAGRVIDAGDFHHQLHHRYYECNYGTTEVPWDHWFGTFHDGSEEATQRIRARRKRLHAG